jgi:UDP-glucose 6-dehydrogenase
MIKVGICGCGFVGNAILQFLLNQYGISLRVYDKYKSLNQFDCLLNSDILFICLPTNYSISLKTYDMSEINATLCLLSQYGFNGIILIKSTVLPNYCSDSNNLYPNLTIIHNPEFLSASTALIDFSTQTHIILGHTQQSISYIGTIQHFYKKIFPLAEISICTSEESAITKLACNSFYATKIQYFTEIYLLCEKMKIPYNTIKNLMLKNGWIDPHHTTVPGHDKMISFGGACFPKDINALAQYMIAIELPSDVLQAVIKERNSIRTDL